MGWISTGRWAGRGWAWVGWILLAAAIAWATIEGVRLRRWAFEETTPLRFGDIYRGWKFGVRASQEGYLDLYDRVIAETINRGGYNELDYAPLRLLTMKLWADERLAQSPGDATQGWQKSHEFSRPVLRFNTLIELWGAVGAGLLTRHWVRKRDRRPGRANALGLLAGAMLWFNPAMILSAHGWPTWDAWIPDFYIWAILLACWNRWGWAGFVIGIGALFKGQQWIVAPLFVLWPIFRWRWDQAGRWVIGTGVAVAMVTAVWALRVPLSAAALGDAVTHARLIPGYGYGSDLARLRTDGRVWNAAAIWWVGTALAAMAVMPVRAMARRGAARGAERIMWGMAQGALGVLAAVLVLRAGGAAAWWAVAGLAAVLVGQWWVRWLWRWRLAAGGLAMALLACFPLLGASKGWYTIGWEYGSHHWEWLVVGQSSNIPGILERSYKWDNQRDLLWRMTLVKPGELWGWPAEAIAPRLKTVLRTVYFAALLASAFGAARMHRAGDARFLAAVVAPWAVMFAIMGQMHERYLLFAAGAGVCFVAIGFGATLLHLFWTAVTFIMTLHVMLLSNVRWDGGAGEFGPQYAVTREIAKKWLSWIAPTHPGIGWAVALSAAVVLAMGLARPAKALPEREGGHGADDAVGELDGGKPVGG